MTDAGRRIVPAGDSAFVVEFEERIDEAVNRQAVALAEAVRAKGIAGVRDVVPTFRSVAVYFDPLRTDADSLMRLLEADVPDAPGHAQRTPIRVPVCYGGEFGPDLGAVAEARGMSAAEVVEIHAGVTYRVYMLGFLPGFAYMGLVDQRIAAARHATPRARVPAGSIGLAGRQTGIYPMDSPGGWQLIGRTPWRPLDLSRENPFRLTPGDAVEFYQIDPHEFEGADA